MRDISEYKLLGNYLVRLYQKHGIDSIKYENAQMVTNGVFSKLNNKGTNYNLLPMESKVKIVQSMINRGVFRTNAGNRLVPFKQVYRFEVSVGISAVYSCDKSLTFKILDESKKNKEQQLLDMEAIYCKDIGLDIQKEIETLVSAYRAGASKGKNR